MNIQKILDDFRERFSPVIDPDARGKDGVIEQFLEKSLQEAFDLGYNEGISQRPIDLIKEKAIQSYKAEIRAWVDDNDHIDGYVSTIDLLKFLEK